MFIEEFGRMFHHGIEEHIYTFCNGCVESRDFNWCVRRGRQPVHICNMTSADAFKNQRFEITMELMGNENAVDACMDKVVDKVSSISCFNIYNM